MSSKIFSVLLIPLLLALHTNAQRWRTINVAVGDHCAPGAAPVGPGGSFQVVERGVKKICAPGTTCRNGACNCDNLSDGTITGISVNPGGTRSCRRVAGQRCSSNNQCFDGVQCRGGVCTCNRNSNDYCVTDKNDVYILA